MFFVEITRENLLDLSISGAHIPNRTGLVTVMARNIERRCNTKSILRSKLQRAKGRERRHNRFLLSSPRSKRQMMEKLPTVTRASENLHRKSPSTYHYFHTSAFYSIQLKIKLIHQTEYALGDLNVWEHITLCTVRKGMMSSF